MKKTISAIDKSVRDHTQRAVISEDRSFIFVESMFGREKVWTTPIKMDEWDRVMKFHKYSFNPAYNKAEFIRQKTLKMDEESGGWCQADRIRDSMITAIDKALAKLK